MRLCWHDTAQEARNERQMGSGFGGLVQVGSAGDGPALRAGARDQHLLPPEACLAGTE